MSQTREDKKVEEATARHDDLLIIEEVAELMRTTPSTIHYKLQVDPDFPRGFKLGVRRLWKRSSIDSWIEAQYASQNEGGA